MAIYFAGLLLRGCARKRSFSSGVTLDVPQLTIKVDVTLVWTNARTPGGSERESELKEGVGKVGQAYVRGIAKHASKADRYLRVSSGGQLVSGIFEPSK